METLSHYHCEIYYCKPMEINLHQTTYNNLYQTTCNQPVPITCKQPTPITYANMYHASTCTSISTIKNFINYAPNMHNNLYHKQVHQPCTKPIQQLVPSTSASTMHQICTNHASNTHKVWIINFYQYHQIYTSCMCQLINYLSQPCNQHVPQPKSLINFIIQIWFLTL